MIRITLFLLCSLISFVTFAQEKKKLSLEQCIEYAQNASLRVKQTEFAIRQNELQQTQAQRNWLPTASGSVQYGLNYGFSINPVNNQVISTGVFTGSYGVNGGMNLYAGGQISNSIIQSEINLTASRSDWMQSKNDVALNVAQAYLQVLLAKELVETAKLQLTSTQEQLGRTEKLIRAGTLAEVARYALDAQSATEQVAIINSENQVKSAMLLLRQTMNYPNKEEFEVEKPDLTSYFPTAYEPSPLKIYEIAENEQYNVRAADLRIKSAEMSVTLAKATRLPTVSAFGQVNTRLSSAAKRATGEIAGETKQPISFQSNLGAIDGVIVSPIPAFESVPFYSQLRQNLGGGIGVSLNVPIYNRGQILNNIQAAQLSVKNAELSAEIVRQSLYQAIERACLDIEISYTSYLSTIEQMKAQQRAYETAQKQFNLGTSTFLDFTLAKNNVSRTQIDQLRAKYDYIFKRKILDFYEGKKFGF
ncbi:MAG: TolC family protein [Bacteroidia bacterium]